MAYTCTNHISIARYRCDFTSTRGGQSHRVW